jgi:hypothetical protein
MDTCMCSFKHSNINGKDMYPFWSKPYLDESGNTGRLIAKGVGC